MFSQMFIFFLCYDDWCRYCFLSHTLLFFTLHILVKKLN